MVQPGVSTSLLVVGLLKIRHAATHAYSYTAIQLYSVSPWLFHLHISSLRVLYFVKNLVFLWGLARVFT
jgi:hypothetical protein